MIYFELLNLLKKIMGKTGLETTSALSLDRLQALTDGIFAIAMTILVLAIDVPESSPSMTGETLHKAILSQSNQLISYFTSFLLLALFWIINHKQTTFLLKTNGTHTWINIFIMIFICLVPYTTSLKGSFIDDWMSNLYWNLNMFFIALLYTINSIYISKQKLFDESRVTRQSLKAGRFANISFLVIVIIASVASVYTPENSAYIYFLIPLLKFFEAKFSKKKAAAVDI